MAYFSQNGAMHGWNGPDGYIPPAPITRILCDDCAESEVPFEIIPWPESAPKDLPPHRRQCAPWKWAPIYGAPCHACSKPA